MEGNYNIEIRSISLTIVLYARNINNALRFVQFKAAIKVIALVVKLWKLISTILVSANIQWFYKKYQASDLLNSTLLKKTNLDVWNVVKAKMNIIMIRYAIQDYVLIALIIAREFQLISKGQLLQNVIKIMFWVI